MTIEQGAKRLDLIGRTVTANDDRMGKVVDAYDPPRSSQGRGIDVEVMWNDGTQEWLDAGDVQLD
jgi:hypothetical protein